MTATTPPSTPLPAAPGTDVAFDDSIYAPYGRLLTAVRIAGLRLDLGEPRETSRGDRFALGDVDEQTAHLLADLIAAHSPVPDLPGQGGTDIAGAGRRLRAVAQAADLDLRPGDPHNGRDGRRLLPLGDADHATMTRLADLVGASLAGVYEAEDALRSALNAIGVAAEQLAADAGALVLGEITVADGDRLLQRLFPGAHHGATDPDDHQAGLILASRITAAVNAATGGGFLNAAYCPCCRKCRAEAAIELGRLGPQVAQRLTARLQEGAT